MGLRRQMTDDRNNGRRHDGCTMHHSKSDDSSHQKIELLDAGQVAEIFGVSDGTIYRWVHEGRLPAVLIGRRTYRFHRAQILSMLEPSILNEAATYQQIAGEFHEDELRARRGAEQENRDTSQ